MSHRNSSYSGYSSPYASEAKQITTQTLLNALHSSYTSSKPYNLESSTSIVVNAWNSASLSDNESRPTVDEQIARRAWEHARRRAEDGCVVLASLHDACPSLLPAFVATLPLEIPTILNTAIAAIYPFIHCSTPQNPSHARYSSFAATFTCALSGKITGITLHLSTSGLDVSRGLLNVPSESGNRAFEVFYYLLSAAATPAEREALGLGQAADYALLRKSGTYEAASYLPTADDAASAEVFRDALKSIGISGRLRRDLLSLLAGLLKLGDTLGLLVSEAELELICEEAAGLLGLDADLLARNLDDAQREVVICGLYEAIVDWVIARANKAIEDELLDQSHRASSDDGSRQAVLTPVMSDEDTVSLTVIEIPDVKLAKAVGLRTVFDDTFGITAELGADGVRLPPVRDSALQGMQAARAACEPELGNMNSAAGQKKQRDLDQRERVLETVGRACEGDGTLHSVLYPVFGEDVGLGRVGRFDLESMLEGSRIWFQLCIHPTDELPSGLPSTAAWSAASASRQLRSFMLPEWANRRNKQLDFTADFDLDEFCTRFAPLGCAQGRDGIESFIAERGWSNGEVKIGEERVWMREIAWSDAENMLDLLSQQALAQQAESPDGFYAGEHQNQSGYFGSPFGDDAMMASRENLLQHGQPPAPAFRSISRGDYGLGTKGDEVKGYTHEVDSEMGDPKRIIEQTLTKSRRFWIGLVWALTFWIPSPLLRYIGGMKRPDVRMAWREKVVLCMIILFINGLVVFYIIEFGRLLCPQYDKVWNSQQVGYHMGDNDFWVSVRGRVYDISKFWRIQHSTITGVTVTSALMDPLRGLNLDVMFPIPLYIGCAGLVTNRNLLLASNSTSTVDGFVHTFGAASPYPDTDLANENWYNQTFMSTMKQYYKGDLVTSRKTIKSQGMDEQYPWFIINDNVYDMSDYAYTLQIEASSPLFTFIDTDLWNIISANFGLDITDEYNKWALKNNTAAELNSACLNNLFYTGKTDVRETPRCEVQNYILLVFTILLCAVILLKFFSALRFGSKPRPAAQDKWVICQIPAYSENESLLRKGIDSLASLDYDSKRKLICVICDGLVTGGGSDRPTSKIALDILGVDPKTDPPALPFKSVGAGNDQLNYGKVYSGLYEHEGNVVPYLVVVKTGKESEQAKGKPGNRGKRDSQILLMSFLNRVHHHSPMSPLELEMYHQLSNVIGVAPELYEYLFMLDADTMVKADSLTRLVAACANDFKVIGICGETSLENEEQSWWTMIQVYEYFISHNLAKAFESLFGSVTCLPGCFSMYRLRTADKGKPVIISDAVIREYAIGEVDTLHKKNLLSLGEDRYLTTLMMKHFPSHTFKFVPEAQALTAAPETWSILLSQRRRWINSTIHNLAELIFLKDMCGFCIFSMRFVVFIDLFGTLILPATCAYLVYLIVRVAIGQGAFPLISIIMIAGVYGLQAIIFIVKRQWQHIGWMIIYMLAYPVYSLILPVYSFWRQDDFSWGQTRVVIGEKGTKQVVALADEGFDPRSIPLMRWDDYAASNGLPGRRVDVIPEQMNTSYLQQTGFINTDQSYGGFGNEKHYPVANVAPYHDNDGGYEMDEMRSTYSTVRPASTILTDLRTTYVPSMMGMQQNNIYQPPISRPGSTFLNTMTPNEMQHQQQQLQMQMQQLQAQQSRPASFMPNFNNNNNGNTLLNRQSTYSSLSLPMSGYSYPPAPIQQQQGYADYPSTLSPPPGNAMARQASTSPYASPAQSPSRNPFNGASSRPVSTFGGLSVAGGASNPFQPPQQQQQQQSTQYQQAQSLPQPQQPTQQVGHQPSNDEITSAIRSCLAIVDLDSVTKKELKTLVEGKLIQTRGKGGSGVLTDERRRWMDAAIDGELAGM